MYCLVYVSAATVPFGKNDLLELLSKARDKNKRLGITGMLLYKDGDFLQLLEGERMAVRGLFETIKADPRHSGTIVMLEEEIKDRAFEDWSMAFRDLSDSAVQSTPGFSQYMNTPLVAESFAKDPRSALQLLSILKPGY